RHVGLRLAQDADDFEVGSGRHIAQRQFRARQTIVEMAPQPPYAPQRFVIPAPVPVDVDVNRGTELDPRQLAADESEHAPFTSSDRKAIPAWAPSAVATSVVPLRGAPRTTMARSCVFTRGERIFTVLLSFGEYNYS